MKGSLDVNEARSGLGRSQEHEAEANSCEAEANCHEVEAKIALIFQPNFTLLSNFLKKNEIFGRSSMELQKIWIQMGFISKHP